MSAGWESGRGGSIVARHEWKGLMRMPGALEDWVEKEAQEAMEHSEGVRRSPRLQRMRRAQHVPGAFNDTDEEDE